MRANSPYIAEKLSHLEDIFTVLRKSQITLSKTMAAKIVGGRYTLQRLVAVGKIRVVEQADCPHAKWHCLAEDVFRCVNYREREKQ